MLNIANINRLISSKSTNENLANSVEEHAEMIKELTKFQRGRGNRQNLVEELADVYISNCITQQMFNITDEELEEEVNKKMKRNLDRVVMEEKTPKALDRIEVTKQHGLNLQKEIGLKIKKARKIKGITQEKFAEMIDKSVSSLQKYESGAIQVPNTILIRIVEILDV